MASTTDDPGSYEQPPAESAYWPAQPTEEPASSSAAPITPDESSHEPSGSDGPTSEDQLPLAGMEQPASQPQTRGRKRAVAKRTTTRRTRAVAAADPAAQAGADPGGSPHPHVESSLDPADPAVVDSTTADSTTASSGDPGETAAAPPMKRTRARRASRSAGATVSTSALSGTRPDATDGSGPADVSREQAGVDAPASAGLEPADPDGSDPDESNLDESTVGDDSAEGAEAEGLLASGQSAGDATTGRAAPTFGLLFQAPEPTVVARRPRPLPVVVEEVEDEADTVEDASPEPVDRGESEGQPRRRRRGGKGRRRPGDDGIEDDANDEDEDETPELAGEPASDPAAGAGARKRTRRRRRSGSVADGDDPPGTVTRVREPRPEPEEATGIKGSTRLEAKRQRRREGREAGRRRTVITEAEFLARRESVERVMVVRHAAERTQIGVLEDGILVEHYVARDSTNGASMAGNVYLGRVQNVLPSMEAAFVDIGKGRNAVLYAGEVNWDAAGLEHSKSRRIENALSSGQSVMVQVTKDPIGHKGARLTSQVSLPGRYLVYVPEGNMTGISRKLPDTERSRLKRILKDIVPDNAGVIVRTAAEGASEAELTADVERLRGIWERIQHKATGGQSPSLLHGEPDLTVRVVRDIFNEDFSSLIVAGEAAWNTVSDYVTSVAPDLAERVSRWTGTDDVFTHYRIDEQLAKALDRKVWLPSGGSLVIDRTEAMTVVDVNTGKFVGSGGNLEETVTKNNIEAAEEIVRQLRLRDIGGIIVIDFIDMVLESNRELVIRRLLECLGRDRTKHQVAEVTSLGLVQMTRKRVGAGLIEVFSEACEHCNGRGLIVHTDPVDRQPAPEPAGPARTGRARRGRGAAPSPVEPAAVERPAPSGPTPAQIAAAAYAAAIHASGHAEPDHADPLADLEADLHAEASWGDAGSSESVDGLTQPGSGGPGPAEQPAASSWEEEATTSDAPAAADWSVALPQDQEFLAMSQSPSRWTDAAPPARRKRTRVIAPAGPPRGAGATEIASPPADPSEGTPADPEAAPADDDFGDPIDAIESGTQPGSGDSWSEHEAGDAFDAHEAPAQSDWVDPGDAAAQSDSHDAHEAPTQSDLGDVGETSMQSDPTGPEEESEGDPSPVELGFGEPGFGQW